MTVAKPGVRHIDVLSYSLIRWGFVAAAAFLYAVLAGELALPSGVAVGWAALAGLMDAVAGGLFYLMAVERTSIHQAATLSSTAPLWGVIASVIFLFEPLHWTAMLSGVMVVAGAYFLVQPRLGVTFKIHSGTLFATATGALWGVSETVVSKLALQAGLSPSMLLVIFSLTAIVGVAAIMPLLRLRVPRHFSRRGMIYLVISAVPGTFLGWVLWLNGLRLAPASLLSPVRGSTMLFSFLYSVVFLRERPLRHALLGVALIFAGVLLVSFHS